MMSETGPGRGTWAAAAVAVLAFVACQEELPTAEDPDLVPLEVTTVEVRLPFSEFASGARVFGGYGRTSELGKGFIASQFGGELEAATLVRFGRYPASAQVLDTTGTTRPDSALSFLSGRIVVRMDTLASVLSGPVEVTAHALTEPWDGTTTSWQNAVDSVGVTVPWSVPGGGALELIGSGTWDPATGDSVSIMVDSARLATWEDSTDFSRGVRLSTTDPGTRLEVESSLLWLETLPSINPDTLIYLVAGAQAFSFIYDPLPEPPTDELRVGGAPAWRSILDLALPEELTGPPELCARVTCPIPLSEEEISFAGLRLTTRAAPVAFAPSDTLSMDMRMVLAPDLLPKSPLGPTVVGFAGEILAPELFGAEAGSILEVPITSLVRDLVRGESISGDPVTNSIALLSLFEPLSLEFVTFEGEGSLTEPELRLILTFSNGIGGSGG